MRSEPYIEHPAVKENWSRSACLLRSHQLFWASFPSSWCSLCVLISPTNQDISFRHDRGCLSPGFSSGLPGSLFAEHRVDCTTPPEKIACRQSTAPTFWIYCYTSRPIVKIAVGSIYTLQDLTNSLPASVPRKLTIASKSDTSILAK